MWWPASILFPFLCPWSGGRLLWLVLFGSLLSICAIWSLRFVFLFIISPSYLYVPVRSSSICPSVNLGFSLVFLIIIVWLFSFPNLMWYFSATLLVMSSSFCFSLGLVSSRTSSIHSRHAMLVSVLGILIPRSVPFIPLSISSISSVSWSTDSTPPCLMLSLMVIFLVAAGRECVPAASYAPVGPFSRPVVAVPAGAVCLRWRVVRVTPGGSWIHVSGPLHRRIADRGHSFGCQQDKPSASLVTTNRTSMCIDLQMCLYSYMLLIVFCWELSYYYYAIKWNHFPRNWPIVRGIHRSPVKPHTKASDTSFDAFFDLRLNKRWVNNR